MTRLWIPSRTRQALAIVAALFVPWEETDSMGQDPDPCPTVAGPFLYEADDTGPAV